MADIELNVEVRDRTGTGGARATRLTERVPGILYGGDRAPVAISAVDKELRKALYTGKLLGHLITLRYGDETQPVIAKDVQFHPVTDRPIHFDLMRVDEHQQIKIEVPVHFKNEDQCPAFRQGGVLEVVRHTVEVLVAADSIPEELVVDLKGHKMGDTIRISDVQLPQGVQPTITDRDFVVASIKGASVVELPEELEAAAEGGADAEGEVTEVEASEQE